MTMKTSNEEFKQMIADYKNGNPDCLEQIAIAAIPMVKHMSFKYKSVAHSFNIPLEDLEQECYIGLLGAVKNFPPDGDSFISFAFSSMSNEMLTYIKYNSHRIVKSNREKGNAEFESMDKELNSFGELSDPFQEEAFENVLDEIDKDIQRRNIFRMLDDILNQDDDIELLRDMYGLDGQKYSIAELCQKYNISMKQLICRERLLILKVKKSKKLQEYIQKLDYFPQEAFKYGVNRFMNSRVSSTEYIAMKHMEYEEQLAKKKHDKLSPNSAKAYLKQAYRLSEQIKEMQMDMQLLKSTKNSTKIEECQNNIQDVTEQFNSLVAAFKQDIETVKDERCALVLEERYVQLKSWEQIADDMQLSTSSVLKIHGAALKEFEPVYLSKQMKIA